MNQTFGETRRNIYCLWVCEKVIKITGNDVVVTLMMSAGDETLLTANYGSTNRISDARQMSALTILCMQINYCNFNWK